MSNYTTFLLRGGTREEHLTGNGTGFVGSKREVTVDTTDNRLRVHDGSTVGGHPLMKEDDNINASRIFFEDGESLQFKLDSGSLGGGGGVNPPEPPPTNLKPEILAIDVKNKLQNGTATVTYFVKDSEQSEFSHEISINNGSSFVSIVPTGDNPYEYIVTNLSLGQNLCALRVSDGELKSTSYFIVDIPNVNRDTPPRVTQHTIDESSTNGFKLKYKVEDDQNDELQRHQISINNGITYSDIFPLLIGGMYEYNVSGLTPSTTYYCRIKVTANNLESLSYPFVVATPNINT